MKKVLVSGMIGNALEWYDYAIYSSFAVQIASNFFPDNGLSVILTYAVFAAGFIIRPIGAIVFGNIGDKMGRRVALAIGILTMAIPTAFIGLLPSYNTIGILAPIFLVIIRLIQGFSLGGEFSGCIAYIVESAPDKYRGIAGSAAFVSMCAGMLFGEFTSAGFKFFLSEEALNSWGWRVPFVAGLFIGLVGLYIRWKLKESEVYQQAKANGYLSQSPVRDLIKNNSKELFIAMGIYLTVTVPFYVTSIYMDKFLVTYAGLSSDQGSFLKIMILIVMISVFPISAFISDNIGRKSIMVSGAIFFILLSYPIFNLMIESSSFLVVSSSAMLLAALCGYYMGPVPTVLVEIFPTKIRFTGVALSYNMSAAFFGGTAPMVSEILIKSTGNPKIISIYIAFFALVTIYSLLYYKETFKNTLDQDDYKQKQFI